MGTYITTPDTVCNGYADSNNGNFGSGTLSPAAPITLPNGTAIAALFQSFTNHAINLLVAGTVAQNAFTQIALDSALGNPQTLASASATAYGQSNGYSYWSWHTSPGPYAPLTEPGAHTFAFS